MAGAASRTLIQLVELVGRFINNDLVFDGTFESSGNTTTSGVDNTLKIYPSDRYNGAWLYIDGGSPTIRNQPVSMFKGAEGQITWRGALGAAPDALAFMILPRSRDEIVTKLHDTRLELMETGMFTRSQTRHIVAGSPLINQDFYDNTNVISAAPNGWISTGSNLIDPDQESGIFARSNILISNDVGEIKQVSNELNSLRGSTVRLHWPVKPKDATSQCRISITDQGGTLASKDSVVSSTPGWQLLVTDAVKIPEAYDDYLTIKMENIDASDGDAYIDMPWISGGPQLLEYPIDMEYVRRVNRVEMSGFALGESIEGWKNSTVGWKDINHTLIPIHYDAEFFGLGKQYARLRLNEAVPNGRVLRLTTEQIEQPFTSASDDDFALSMTESESQLVAAATAANILADDLPKVHPDSREKLGIRIGALNRLAGDLTQGLHSYTKPAARQPMVM